MASSLKLHAYNYCKEYVHSKMERIHLEMDKIKDALQSETKSTAGDKHETGRAMLQLEREKLGKQLSEVEKMQKAFEQISMHPGSGKIRLGSLVTTDKAIYFIAVSAGRVRLEGKEVYCISVAAPIGRLLLGKSAGHSIAFNGKIQKVITVH